MANRFKWMPQFVMLVVGLQMIFYAAEFDGPRAFYGLGLCLCLIAVPLAYEVGKIAGRREESTNP